MNTVHIMGEHCTCVWILYSSSSAGMLTPIKRESLHGEPKRDIGLLLQMNPHVVTYTCMHICLSVHTCTYPNVCHTHIYVYKYVHTHYGARCKLFKSKAAGSKMRRNNEMVSLRFLVASCGVFEKSQRFPKSYYNKTIIYACLALLISSCNFQENWRCVLLCGVDDSFGVQKLELTQRQKAYWNHLKTVWNLQNNQGKFDTFLVGLEFEGNFDCLKMTEIPPFDS